MATNASITPGAPRGQRPGGEQAQNEAQSTLCSRGRPEPAGQEEMRPRQRAALKPGPVDTGQGPQRSGGPLGRGPGEGSGGAERCGQRAHTPTLHAHQRGLPCAPWRAMAGARVLARPCSGLRLARRRPPPHKGRRQALGLSWLRVDSGRHGLTGQGLAHALPRPSPLPRAPWTGRRGQGLRSIPEAAKLSLPPEGGGPGAWSPVPGGLGPLMGACALCDCGHTRAALHVGVWGLGALPHTSLHPHTLPRGLPECSVVRLPGGGPWGLLTGLPQRARWAPGCPVSPTPERFSSTSACAEAEMGPSPRCL